MTCPASTCPTTSTCATRPASSSSAPSSCAGRCVGAKVVDELETIAAQRVEQFSAPDMTLDTMVRGAWGPAPPARTSAPASSTSGPTSRTSARPSGAPATSTPAAPPSSWTCCSPRCPGSSPATPASRPATSSSSTSPARWSGGPASGWRTATTASRAAYPCSPGIAHDGDPDDVFTTHHAVDRRAHPARGGPRRPRRHPLHRAAATRTSPAGCSRTSSSSPERRRRPLLAGASDCLRHTTIS